MTRAQRGWLLFRQSGAILWRDKTLVLFPILSGVACLLVIAAFLLPIVAAWPVLAPHFQAMRQEGEDSVSMKILSFLLTFSFYLICYFVIVFFNTALISCVLQRFRGETPTVRGGLSAAMQRLPQILGWAFLAATVGTLLRQLEERFGFLGRMVIGLIGVVWSVATVLVVPTLAAEGTGPILSLKRSATLIRETWGEALTAQLSMNVGNGILSLPFFVLLVAAFLLIGATNSMVLPIVTGVIALLYLVALVIISSAMQQIILAGVYLYASEKIVAPGLSSDAMTGAFEPKKKR